jgi:O-antigen/teichoic acid export membrane protein
LKAISKSSLSFWARLLSHYFATQVAIMVINLTSGFLIIRSLSLPEYATYFLSATLISICGLLSDFGAGHGIVSLGAPKRDDSNYLTSLFLAGRALRATLFVVVGPLVIGLGYWLFVSGGVTAAAAGILSLMVVLTAWIQQGVSLRTSILNIRHDSGSLAKANAASAITRLVLIAYFCPLLPFAWVALAINAFGVTLSSELLRRSSRLGETASTNEISSHIQALRRFIIPLAPGIIYFAFQANISTFLLTAIGATISVAELGALGRLGQVIAILAVFNGFFVQPYFSRIDSAERFRLRLRQAIGAMIALFGVLLASAVAAPQAWLFVLGSAYSGLTAELPLAVLSAELATAGAFLYTVVISRGRTEGQFWQIVLGLSSQILFLAVHGIRTTMDALIFNTLPSVTYLLLQAYLLSRLPILNAPLKH